MKISCNDEGVQKAASAINDGAVIVFPTDTVYGLGCNPYNHDSVLSLYEIKKREKTKPFPVLGYSKEELEKIAEFSPLEEKIAVRVPNNKCALALLKECKLLVGTSANISDARPFSDPKECGENLAGYDLFIDGGIISSKGESTIVEVENNDVKVLRKGSISEEMIKELN